MLLEEGPLSIQNRVSKSVQILDLSSVELQLRIVVENSFAFAIEQYARIAFSDGSHRFVHCASHN